MDKKKIYVGAAIALVLVIGYFSFGSENNETVEVLVNPTVDDLVVSVTTSGELRAKNSTKIMGPQNARKARIWNIKINKLIEEGTEVQAGDFVAELDKSELDERIQDRELGVQEKQTVVDQAVLDSTLTLSQARDALDNLEFQLEEKKITMEQSKYESPSVQRQAKIDYERTLRQLAQEKKNYITKVKQSEAKIKEKMTDLEKERRELEDFYKLRSQFIVKAPQNGMVVYSKEWSGKKITEGSQINVWEPVVAELPDMSVMESVTYINEVDIKKVVKGQKVEIGLDSEPDKLLEGVVTDVANIGEQRPNADSKVFEVIVEVTTQDSTLRPSMSTSNKIIVKEIDDVITVPLEAIHSDESSIFVYVKQGLGIKKQQVILGEVNDEIASIKEGLGKEDQVFLSIPADTTGLDYIRVDGDSIAENN